ncbi:MAG: hypothetical protein FGM52_03605 [Mycobacterium sp.]|nr:hypothetical protein [Mycobacterium sp.]
MADATTFRLDTADSAMEAGWELEHMSRIDEFSRDGVTVMVQYAANDEIESLTRSREGSADEVFGVDSPGKAERLRIWLGVRTVSDPIPSPEEDDPKIPISVRQLRARGMSLAAYVKTDDDFRLLELVDNNAYATARDYIKARNGGKKVMWKKDGLVSEPGPQQEMWWAEFPLPDGRAVGWFQVNHNFSGR